MENIMSHFLDTLTEEEQKIFLGKDSDDKKQIKKERISAIKEAAQAIANATYTELENGKQIPATLSNYKTFYPYLSAKAKNESYLKKLEQDNIIKQ
jgi:hypothetical protein